MINHIEIEQVLPFEQVQDVLVEDQLDIQWFETSKDYFKRATKQGVTVVLKKQSKRAFYQNDVLLFQGKAIARIAIVPCLCIVFRNSNFMQIADFCYYIGNRHLPVYQHPDQKLTFMVAYDGRLFEQLQAKFGQDLFLEEQILLAQNQVKTEK